MPTDVVQQLSPSRFRDGLRALAAGTPAAALPLLRGALHAGEDAPWAGLNLALALVQLGRYAEALPLLEQAVLALPHLAEPQFHLGTILGLRGAPEQAAERYCAALAIDPDHVLALAGLAALEEAAGRRDVAGALVARARHLAPAEPELEVAAARLALGNDDPARALALAGSVLVQRPAHLQAVALYADALWALHGRAGAAAALAAAATPEPARVDWPLVAAALHARQGELPERVAALRIATLLLPDRDDLLAELGKALSDADQRVEAEAVLRAAAAARPADVDLRNWLATLLWRLHRPAEMLATLDAALADFGEAPALHINRALALNAMGDQEGAVAAADAAIASSDGAVNALIGRMSVQAYHPRLGSAAAMLATGRAIADRLGPAAPRPERDRDPDRPLRIGLLSGGLGAHPVGWLTIAGLEALAAKPDFELAGYALRYKRDPLNSRYRSICQRWHELAAASDAAIAGTIAQDQCDILLDLGGYGDSGRPRVLHHRPAPVQIKWVGAQFATMGLDCVDWMLTDRWETPDGYDHLYTERLLRLPDGYVCYAPPAYAPPVMPTPALRNGHVTFGCFNNLAKLTPTVLALWAGILVALPDARLELRSHMLREPATQAAFGRRCETAGLPMDRVALRPGCRHAELLAAYGGIDIALDPFPYAGGLTVCEALWMGVPVIAKAGDSFAARHAGSHLSNVGMEDWVAPDQATYLALAIARARDVAGLAALRANQRDRVARSPLCDGPRFGEGLGAALRLAWRAHCGASVPT